MKFIKGLLNAIFHFATRPFVRLAKCEYKSRVAVVLDVADALARVVYVASFFTAVPALAVKLAIIWVFLIPGIATLAVLIMSAILIKTENQN